MCPTIQTPIVETLPYAAGQTRTLALPRIGSIHHLDLRLQLQYDVINADPGYNQDFIAKLIQSIAIKDGQARTWWGCGDGRQLYWWNYLLSGGKTRMDTMSTSVVTDELAEALFQIHFGSKPLNPFDPSSAIPAVELPSLALEITWRNAENLVTTPANFNLDAMTVTVTPAQLTEREYEAARRTILLPNVRSEKYPIVAAQGEIGARRELPAGSLLRQTALVVLDADDTRMDVVTDADKDVTEVGYIKVRENTIPFREAWQTLQGRNMVNLGLPAMTGWEGVAMVDWAQIAGDIALNLERRGGGSDVIGFTTVDTGGSICLLHIAYARG